VARTIIVTAEVAAPPERVFRALITDEVERWWSHPDFYRSTDRTTDLRATLNTGSVCLPGLMHTLLRRTRRRLPSGRTATRFD
jgi:hypothetical protein